LADDEAKLKGLAPEYKTANGGGDKAELTGEAKWKSEWEAGGSKLQGAFGGRFTAFAALKKREAAKRAEAN
jgi:hypothetical protein